MIWPFNPPKPADYQPGNGMDAESRKKAFWLIKKFSSLEAWTRKYEAYKHFSEEMEKLAALPHQTEDSFFRFRYKEVLDELIQFEKALKKLRHGDRSCFKWGVSGSFAHTYSMAAYIARVVTDEREFIIEEDTTALKETLRELTRNSAVGAESCREVAPCDPWVRPLSEINSRYGPYPQCHPLPEVPLAVPLVQIKTGEEIPVTGIWEPNTPGAAMDYQLAGTEAPEVKVSHARGLEPTVWTLLWADHRYEDGSIPEEEALFFAIPETPPPAPADSGPTRCEGGRPCPSPFFPTAVQEPL